MAMVTIINLKLEKIQDHLNGILSENLPAYPAACPPSEEPIIWMSSQEDQILKWPKQHEMLMINSNYFLRIGITEQKEDAVSSTFELYISTLNCSYARKKYIELNIQIW